MPPRDALVDHCAELLSPLGSVRAKRMFGGHGIYVDDVFVAIVAFDRLYLKTDDATRERFRDAGCGPFVYDSERGAVSLGYWTAPPEALESPALMRPWARLALEAALRARAAKDAPIRRRTKARPAAAKAAGSSDAAAVRQPRGRKAAGN